MYPFKLGKRATVAEAQAATKYTPLQYKSFSVSFKACKNLMQQYDAWTRWTLVPPETKAESLNWVNAELAKLNISEVREDIFDWRMSKALPDAARAMCRLQTSPIICITDLMNAANKNANAEEGRVESSTNLRTENQ
ncbi:hypothetical protein IQ07DRAFT_599258 [Pyrenochaeta sp. DS3sAY3a]|nr:hypothetical protein IQ07DRAFT_599258 [Pyrenochaeta sp. DS3sAY3a]